jgi:hypothetical protein
MFARIMNKFSAAAPLRDENLCIIRAIKMGKRNGGGEYFGLSGSQLEFLSI